MTSNLTADRETMSRRIVENSARTRIASPARPFSCPAAPAFWGGISSPCSATSTRRCCAKPCKVISVDNYITGEQAALHEGGHHDPNIIDVWADVSYPLPVREDLHFIMHAAGVASPVYYMKYPLETIESAVQGTKNLLELARKNKDLEGFLFFSSSEIYGDPDPKSVPTPETYHGYVSSVGPRACYDESKRLGETISTIYQQQYGVPDQDRAAVQRVRSGHEAQRPARHSDVHLSRR